MIMLAQPGHRQRPNCAVLPSHACALPLRGFTRKGTEGRSPARSAPLSPPTPGEFKPTDPAHQYVTTFTAGSAAGHGSGSGVAGHPGGGVRADGSPVAAHDATPDGRSNYRTVVAATVRWARKVRSNRAGRRAGRQNLAAGPLGAGPRAAARPQLLPADAAVLVGGSVGFAGGGVPGPACCCGSVGPHASAASAGLLAGSARCNSGPGDARAGTSVHSPSASSAGSRRDAAGRAGVLDPARGLVETEVGPRER